MKWYEITLTTTHEGSELFSDILFSAGVSGVSVYDRQDILSLREGGVIWDYIDEKLLENADERVYVKGIIGEESKNEIIQSIEDNIAEMRKISPFNLGSGEIIVTEIDDEDWRNEWKKYYKPIVTRSVTVVPEWIKYDAKEGERLLWIEPGMAFGTGEHETTKMCLDFLGDIEICGKSVIDVGAGSGILGIAAVLCGAKSAYMCDIDSTAIVTARKNAELNMVTDCCVIELSDLLNKKTKADLIFANITADILIRLSGTIADYLNGGGKIILSGIIHDRLDDVKNAFEKAGLRLVGQERLGEWNALLLTL